MANLWICAYDLHFPKVHKPTFNAMIDFMARNKNKIAGFYFGGDQQDNSEISHHNSGKPFYKPLGSYDKNTRGFDEQILKRIEANLPKTAEKVWQIGNHDNWEFEFVENHPEFEGVIERPKLLNLEKRGWDVLPIGHTFRIGKLSCIHGETLTGIGNQAPQAHARKAVDVYAGNILFGHTHNPQTFTKILPFDAVNKWQGVCAPILGSVNPAYMRNRPNAWMNGFVIVELMDGGNFNLYSVLVFNGKFSFGGEVYGK